MSCCLMILPLMIFVRHVLINPATKTELGISSFGVSVTTMEEVFIRVGTGDDEALKSR